MENYDSEPEYTFEGENYSEGYAGWSFPETEYDQPDSETIKSFFKNHFKTYSRSHERQASADKMPGQYAIIEQGVIVGYVAEDKKDKVGGFTYPITLDQKAEIMDALNQNRILQAIFQNGKLKYAIY